MKPKKSSSALIVSLILHLIIGVVGFFFWPTRNTNENQDAINAVLMEIEKPTVKRISRPKRAQVQKEIKETTQSNQPRLKVLTSNAPATERGIMSAAQPTSFNSLDSLDLSDGIGLATNVITPQQMPQMERVATGPVRPTAVEDKRPKSRLVKFIERQEGPQQIIYCIDLSSSMISLSPLKLHKILSIMEDSLDFLEPHDRFNVMTFSEDIKFYRPDYVSVNESDISAATDYLDHAKPTKSSRASDRDMLEALQEGKKKQPTIIVLFSDGIPTSGISDLKMIRQYATGDARIFTMAIGMAQDFLGAVFLRELADPSGGEFWLVEAAN